MNKKIEQLLNENPSKTSVKNNLAATFNTERAELENAVIKETDTDDDAIKKAEQALEKFKLFLLHYNRVEKILESAIADLIDYETDSNRSLEEKYGALMLLLKIRNSSTLEEAENVLKLYKDFKTGASTPVGNESNLSHLSDEHRKYFEEILKILKENFVKDSSEMVHFLKQILMNPELLKQLYEALKDVSEEDENDWWSLIF